MHRKFECKKNEKEKRKRRAGRKIGHGRVDRREFGHCWIHLWLCLANKWGRAHLRIGANVTGPRFAITFFVVLSSPPSLPPSFPTAFLTLMFKIPILFRSVSASLSHFVLHHSSLVELKTGHYWQWHTVQSTAIYNDEHCLTCSLNLLLPLLFSPALFLKFYSWTFFSSFLFESPCSTQGIVTPVHWPNTGARLE